MSAGGNQALKRLALRGSGVELAGYGLSIVLRLGGNIVLSRLLFPKAFGLAAEVSFVLFGLAMLSDVGIRQCVIQSPRGDEPDFLDTAFSMQVLRGAALTALGLTLSVPAALYWFREPELLPLLLAANFQNLILGFHSTSVLTLRRRLEVGWVNALELGQQVVGLSVMIVWAKLHPSVWALIGGTLAGATVYSLGSHFLPVGRKNRFRWDRSAYLEMSRFGRWIFGSSAVTFFASQGDRALFGRYFGAKELGVYQVAAELSNSAAAVVERLIAGVLYPLLSRARTERSPEELTSIYYRARLALDLFAQSALGFLCAIGAWIVELIWDPRYWGAGSFLPMLCLRAATSCLVTPAECCLTSLGMPRYGFWRSLIRAVSVWLALPIGFHFGGVPGMVWAVAVTELPSLVLVWFRFRTLGMLRVGRELMAVAIFVAAYAVGSAIVPWLPEWHLPHGHAR